ncbi:MAG: hypothetical protein ACJ8FY_27650 [Gemmataceae bacterium]
MNDTTWLTIQTANTRARFIKAEIQTGLALVRLASVPHHLDGHREKTIANAKRAYDTAVRYLSFGPDFSEQESERRWIDESLEELQESLQHLQDGQDGEADSESPLRNAVSRE